MAHVAVARMTWQAFVVGLGQTIEASLKLLGTPVRTVDVETCASNEPHLVIHARYTNADGQFVARQMWLSGVEGWPNDAGERTWGGDLYEVPATSNATADEDALQEIIDGAAAMEKAGPQPFTFTTAFVQRDLDDYTALECRALGLALAGLMVLT